MNQVDLRLQEIEQLLEHINLLVSSLRQDVARKTLMPTSGTRTAQTQTLETGLPPSDWNMDGTPSEPTPAAIQINADLPNYLFNAHAGHLKCRDTMPISNVPSPSNPSYTEPPPQRSVHRQGTPSSPKSYERVGDIEGSYSFADPKWRKRG